MSSSESAPKALRLTDAPAPASARYRIGTLLYLRDVSGRLLLMQRRRSPNRGLWCAVGGKLEMGSGESPFECAIREAREEVGLEIEAADLALRAILSERDYEGTGHWLMFIFECGKRLETLPEEIDEGRFAFFESSDLSRIAMPPMDREIWLERLSLGSRSSLHVLRAASGAASKAHEVVEEEAIGLER